MSANMSAKRPETLSLDRLQTPIGTALLAADVDGVLRAFDWEDHASRMNELLRLQYGAVVLQDASAPEATRAALSAYFNGDLAALSAIKWRIAGTSFQRKVWTALSKIPPGTTMTYGALAANWTCPGRCVRLDMPTARTRSASWCPAIA